MKKYFNKIFLNSFFLFAFFSFSFLQTAFALDVSIRQFPNNPKAGEDVKLTIESDKYDLDRSTITWTVDGQIVDTGFGRRTHILRVTNDKVSQVVSVKIEEEGKFDGAAQHVVVLSTDFILTEGAQIYTPPFYKGRKVPVSEGAVRVALMSYGSGEVSRLTPNPNTNFRWKINGDDKFDLSGGGKFMNTINSGIVDKNLQISIFKSDESGVKENTVNIPLGSTDLVVKKLDPKKVISINLKETEAAKNINLIVEPYFYSITDKKDGNLKYSWKVNEIEYPISTPWYVNFANNNNETVRINLDLFNSRKLSQKNSRGFTFKGE